MKNKMPEITDEELLAALGGTEQEENVLSHEIQVRRVRKSVAKKDSGGTFTIASNNLIQNASYCLSPMEDAIIQVASAKLPLNDSELKPVYISGREVLLACQMNPTSGKNIASVKSAIDSLATKPIKIAIEDEETGKRVETTFNWFDHSIILSEKGKYVQGKLLFHRFLKPELLGLKSNFTKTYLKYGLPIKDVYARRLYRLCKSKHFDTLKPYTFYRTLSEIKQDLGLIDISTDGTITPDNKYDEWSRLKQRRLDPAIKAINEKTDINVFYDRVVGDNGSTIGVDITVEIKDPVTLLKLEMKIKESDRELDK